MKARQLGLPPRITTFREHLLQRWRAFAPRERAALTVAFVLLGVFVLWLVAVQPAWRTLRNAPAQLGTLDAQWQQMLLLAAETRELRSAVPVPASQAMAALRAATDRLGEKAKLSVQGERATLTVTGLPGDQLGAWLAEARSAARARPIEASLTRAAQGYNGTLVVTLGGAS